MPHIIVEHTDDVKNVAELISDLHHSLAAQETVTLNAIKSRAMVVQDAYVGDTPNGSMIHVTLKLLSGRSGELRAKMTRDLFSVIKEKVSANISVTVESIELHNESYQK